MLTGKQRSYLRGKGNRLDPILHIGKEGITESILEQLEEALDDHELVKVRVLNNSPEDEIKQVANELAEECKGEIVQVIGNVFLIYRRNEEEPIFNLP